MNRCHAFAISLTLIWSGFIPAQQPPAKSSILDRPGPDEPQPGLICRVYLDGSSDAKKFPTHLLAVAATGKEFNANHKPAAMNELRGFIKSQSIFYVAFGYIVLEKDAEVKFTLDKAECYVGGKNLGGGGTYSQPLKAGRHPIEITRQWGQGQGDFVIVEAATGKSVLFHTQEMLDRELKRSFKVGGKTFKTKRLDESASDQK